MSDTYATRAQLVARLSAAYTAPADPEATQLLMKASELIEYATLGRSAAVFASGTQAAKDLLANATCDQVEAWLEVGEESDVVGLTGMLQSGRLMIGKLPPRLGQRAARTLRRGGLLWSGAGAI